MKLNKVKVVNPHQVAVIFHVYTYLAKCASYRSGVKHVKNSHDGCYWVIRILEIVCSLSDETKLIYVFKYFVINSLLKMEDIIRKSSILKHAHMFSVRVSNYFK